MDDENFESEMQRKLLEQQERGETRGVGQAMTIDAILRQMRQAPSEQLEENAH